MKTEAPDQQHHELLSFIEQTLAPEPTVQGVVGIGSIASGLARPDSDIVSPSYDIDEAFMRNAEEPGRAWNFRIW